MNATFGTLLEPRRDRMARSPVRGTYMHTLCRSNTSHRMLRSVDMGIDQPRDEEVFRVRQEGELNILR
jgi:hypothetical protein